MTNMNSLVTYTKATRSCSQEKSKLQTVVHSYQQTVANHFKVLTKHFLTQKHCENSNCVHKKKKFLKKSINMAEEISVDFNKKLICPNIIELLQKNGGGM